MRRFSRATDTVSYIFRIGALSYVKIVIIQCFGYYDKERPQGKTEDKMSTISQSVRHVLRECL